MKDLDEDPADARKGPATRIVDFPDDLHPARAEKRTEDGDDGEDLSWARDARMEEEDAILLKETIMARADREIADRYGAFIDSDHRKPETEARVQFDSRRAFRERLLEINPNLDSADLERTLGFWDGKTIFVRADANKEKLLNTVIHEKLHALSSPHLGVVLGKPLEEGSTEHLTAKLIPVERGLFGHALRLDPETRRLVPDEEARAPCYEQEERLVSMIEAQAGEEALAKAYFQGDLSPLRDRLGSEIFDELADLSRQGRVLEAQSFLLRSFAR